MLDSEDLERLSGFKKFAFHIGLDEFKPEYLANGHCLDLILYTERLGYFVENDDEPR